MRCAARCLTQYLSLLATLVASGFGPPRSGPPAVPVYRPAPHTGTDSLAEHWAARCRPFLLLDKSVTTPDSWTSGSFVRRESVKTWTSLCSAAVCAAARAPAGGRSSASSPAPPTWSRGSASDVGGAGVARAGHRIRQWAKLVAPAHSGRSRPRALACGRRLAWGAARAAKGRGASWTLPLLCHSVLVSELMFVCLSVMYDVTSGSCPFWVGK